MDDAVETRRKRLLFQSTHRGNKENDLLLGAFAEEHLAGFSAAQLARYEALLDEDDQDIFDWMTERRAPPAEKMTDVLALLLAFKYPGAR